jgi:oligopeptide/dipeptide ABC transporter ATP-binding protein
MRMVNIPSPELRVDDYPHQLSGGMRQRVMIAMAMACEPRLLIADEPTTALDVTVQAQILALIRGLKQRKGMGVLLITHDLGVIAGMADRVIVMYAGHVMEEAPARALFADARHPYTRLLLRSVPRVSTKLPRLNQIAGTTPPPTRFPSGCRFHPRCPDAIERCRVETPPLEAAPDGRRVRCWRAGETGLASAS